jgi:hypothetical protein
MQLFGASNKGFIYVTIVPIKSKCEFPMVSIVSQRIWCASSTHMNSSGKRTSIEFKRFNQQILGTITLKAFEEGTQWSNSAELYIGLIK